MRSSIHRRKMSWLCLKIHSALEKALANDDTGKFAGFDNDAHQFGTHFFLSRSLPSFQSEAVLWLCIDMNCRWSIRQPKQYTTTYNNTTKTILCDII